MFHHNMSVNKNAFNLEMLSIRCWFKTILSLRDANGPAHEIFGIYCIREQIRLRRACAYAQSRQSLCLSHTQSIEVDIGSDKILDL